MKRIVKVMMMMKEGLMKIVLILMKIKNNDDGDEG